MRNNPKLLMQMIPDAPEDFIDTARYQSSRAGRMAIGALADGAAALSSSTSVPADAMLKRSRIHEKIQEAQRW